MKHKINPLFIFLIFWVISFVFYFKTRGAGFVTDEIGWLQNYKSTGWTGILYAFSDKSLHYIYHIFGFLLWKFLGLNGFAWMMAFVVIHAAVATVSFSVFRELFQIEEIPSSSIIAFAGSLLFIISPYQTEAMVWYACIHYLICSLLLFLSFYFLLRYLQQTEKKFIIAFYACFILSLFTLEISLVFPIILLVFFLFWPPKILRAVSRLKLIKIFVLPSFSLLILYFLLSKILRGSVVGHYGASQHLNFDVPLLMGNLSKYISKLFFLTQFLSYDNRHALYTVFEKEKFGWSLFLVLSCGLILFTILHRGMKGRFRIPVLLFGFFSIALLPILNLFFTYLINVEGDRFTYFPSIFAYQFIALSAILLFRKFGWILLAVFLFFNIKFLLYNTGSWSDSRLIQNSLVEKFRWYEADRIYLLNFPDNLRGTYMFRSFQPNNFFVRALSIKTGKDVEEKTWGIAAYNMNSVSDSVRVEKISDNELKVIFAQGGNWWWNDGIGASNYSTNDYEIKIDEWSSAYNIVFKNKIPNSAYLYQCGGEWREVKDF